MLINEIQELAAKLQVRGGGKTMAAKIAGIALPTFSHVINGKSIVATSKLPIIRDAIVEVLIIEKMNEGFTPKEVCDIANISENKLKKIVQKFVIK